MTLIELIITLAVGAILLTVAVPGFQNVVATNRVAGQTNELLASLQTARSEAIKRGRTVTVCKSSNTDAAATATAPGCDTSASGTWPDGWIVFVDLGTRGTRDGADDTLLKVAQLASHNSIGAGANVAKFVSFNRDGTLSVAGTDASRTLTICVPPQQRQVVINKIGQVSLTKGSCE